MPLESVQDYDTFQENAQSNRERGRERERERENNNNKKRHYSVLERSCFTQLKTSQHTYKDIVMRYASDLFHNL